MPAMIMQYGFRQHKFAVSSLLDGVTKETLWFKTTRECNVYDFILVLINNGLAYILDETEVFGL